MTDVTKMKQECIYGLIGLAKSLIRMVWWEVSYGFENLVLFPVMKEFWNYVKKWQSYAMSLVY